MSLSAAHVPMSLREIEPIQPTLHDPLPRTARRVYYAVALLLGLAVFYPVLSSWFSSEELVLFNALQHDLFAIWWGADRQPGFFRPVISLIAYGWEAIFGLRAWAFHGLSVAFHLVNSILVIGVARQWTAFLRPDERLRAPSIAMVCGAWFWIWPSHSEPVGWIPGLTDVAAATGLLSSLLMYLRSRNGGGRWWLTGALFAYLVALCTKEAAITLPGVIIIYELMRSADSRRILRKNVTGPITFCVLMAIYFLFRRWWMGAFLGGYGGELHKDFTWGKIHLALAPNLSNAFAPVPGLTLHQKDFLMGAMAVFLLVAAMIARRRIRAALPMPAAAVGALILFLPGINLGPGLFVEGQRFAYIPSSLAVISIVYAIALVLPGRRAFLATGYAGMILGAAVLGWYNMAWRDAGKASREIVQGMAELPHVRKLFVLATTDSTAEAFIMPHSLQAVAQVMLENPPAQQMPVAVAVSNWRPEVQINVLKTEREGQHGWLVELTGINNEARDTMEKRMAPRFDVLNFTPNDWAEITPLNSHRIFVRPNDFDPSLDRLVYLNGTKWIIL